MTITDKSRAEFSDAMESLIWSILSGIHTCLPGRITAWDGLKASVKPLIQKKYLDGTSQPLPVITGVPLIFPRTKKAGMTFPVESGDGILLVFSERNMDSWIKTGEDKTPKDSRKFDLSDCVGIPGLFDFPAGTIQENNTDVTIHSNNSKIILKSDGTIHIGENNLVITDGVLTGETIDPFTGQPYKILPTNISQKVRASFS